MKKKQPISNVQVPCRFCGKLIWAQSDNGEPECVDCWWLDFETLRDNHEVELTLYPLTEHLTECE